VYLGEGKKWAIRQFLGNFRQFSGGVYLCEGKNGGRTHLPFTLGVFLAASLKHYPRVLKGLRKLGNNTKHQIANIIQGSDIFK